MAGTVKAILGRAPGHSAAEVRALAIGGDDPAGRVEQEESALPEEDRPIVRGGEDLKDLRLRSDGDRVAEPQDPVDPNERRDERGELDRREAERAEEAGPQDCAPPPAQDRVVRCSEPKHFRTSTPELLRRVSR